MIIAGEIAAGGVADDAPLPAILQIKSGAGQVFPGWI